MSFFFFCTHKDGTVLKVTRASTGASSQTNTHFPFTQEAKVKFFCRKEEPQLNRPAQAAARDHVLPCTGSPGLHPNAERRGSSTSAFAPWLAAAVPAKSQPGLKGRLHCLPGQDASLKLCKFSRSYSYNKALTTPPITGVAEGLSSEFVKVKSGMGDTQVSQISRRHTVTAT